MSTLFAIGAILLWASLALSSAKLSHLPPFFVLGVAFLIGALPVLLNPRKAFPPRTVLLVGVAGYYGYHFFLFTALRLAPPVEANLINYLWPMLLVLMTPLFFKESKLTIFHLLGAGLALVGCVLLMQGKESGEGQSATLGYVCAVAAAFAWPLFSLTKKKLPSTPTITIAGVCLVAALLCWPTHYLFEDPVSLRTGDWYLLVWLGLGPFGLAFYLWDMALREGDPRIVGALSYLTPVLSTVGLVFFTAVHPPWTTWTALGLITLGAAVGAWRSRPV